MSVLRMHLKGVLQYYASTKHGAVTQSGVLFKTEKYPTKRAVTGMIGAAMGIARFSEELNELYNKIDMRYKTIKAGSVMTEFYTISPLDENDFFYDICGKPVRDEKKNKGIKEVEYLQDYEFLVNIKAPDDLLKKIYDAFQNPVYTPYLGRRICHPSVPIVDVAIEDAIIDDFEEGMKIPNM